MNNKIQDKTILFGQGLFYNNKIMDFWTFYLWIYKSLDL